MPASIAQDILKKAQELKLAGSTYKEIAKSLGISACSIISHFQKGNGKSSSQGKCSICGREVPRLFRHHPSYEDLGVVVKICGLCHSHIHHHLRVESNKSGPDDAIRICHCCWGTGSKLDNKQLGSIARQRRKDRGESQYLCSVRLGISSPFLSLLERGKRSWTRDLWEKAVS